MANAKPKPAKAVVLSERKFYKTVFTVTMLSENPVPPGISLAEIVYEITDGDCSGDTLQGSTEILSGKQMAGELIEQGSSPEFFMLNSAGEDAEG